MSCILISLLAVLIGRKPLCFMHLQEFIFVLYFSLYYFLRLVDNDYMSKRQHNPNLIGPADCRNLVDASSGGTWGLFVKEIEK